MKFQKGLLDDIVQKPGKAEEVAAPTAAAERPQPEPALVDVEKNRLFETVEKETGSERKYLLVLGVIVLVVAAIGFVISYLSAPGIGDTVRAPAGLEESVRDHLLTKEKRVATDITFYRCDGFYWARVSVETRSDIANPIFKVGSYSARAVQDAGQFTITTAPITTPEMDVPCK